MVLAIPHSTVYHKTPVTFPGKRKHHSSSRTDPGPAVGSTQGEGAQLAQRQEVFSPSQSPGWTSGPCASPLAAGGHPADMDHWRGVYVGGVEPMTGFRPAGKLPMSGICRNTAWWKKDRGSCPKGHKRFIFYTLGMVLATSVLRTARLFPQS